MSDSNLSNEQEITGGSQSQAPSMDFQDYFFAVKERLWVVLLVFFVCITIGVTYILRTQPVYRSTAVLEIQQRGEHVMRVDPVAQTDLSTQDVMNTIVESIRSRTVLLRTVESLNLQDNTDFIEKKEDGTPTSKEEALGMLRSCIKIVLRPKTRLVDVVADHTNPEMARILADAVAREFIRFGFDQRMASSRIANQFLYEEAAKLRDKVRQTETALQEYREKNHAASLDNKQNRVIDQLKDLSGRLNQARAERLGLETDQVQAKKMMGNVDELLKIPSIARLQSVATIVNTITAKELDFSTLKQQYLPKHPKYIAAASELENLKRILAEKANEGANLITSSYQVASENEQRIAKQVEEQEQVALDLNKKSIEYNVIKSELETDQAMYQSVLGRVKEIDVTQGIDGSPIKLMEAATTPALPDHPKPLATTIISVVMGLLLGVISALGLNMSNPGLKTVTQAENRIGLPVFSAVPYRGNARGRKKRDLAEGPTGLVKEAFRTLRTSLSLLKKDAEQRSFLITSALPSEGKTFVSCNISILLAQGGTKTLLIDADLRKPSVSKLFFERDEKPGLSDLLNGSVSMGDTIRETSINNLYVITAGEKVRNPDELLNKPAMQKVIDEALLSFDKVIIDTAPVLAVSDTLLFASKVQTVCLVVLAGKTPSKAVERACKCLADADHVPDGLVMNQMAGQSYYYYGHYGSKEVYGETATSS